MRSWLKWRDRKRERSEMASRAAQTRWDRYHADMASVPVREDLPIVALRATIEQPGRPRRVLELRRRDGSHKCTMMFENDHNCGPGGKAKLFRLAERSTHI
jgi:hypothetical protein